MKDRKGWRVSLIVLTILASITSLVLLAAWWPGYANVAKFWQTPTSVITVTFLPTSAIPSPQSSPFPITSTTTPISLLPTPTSTRVVVPKVDPTGTAQAAQRATAQAEESAKALAQLQSLTGRPTHAQRASNHSLHPRDAAGSGPIFLPGMMATAGMIATSAPATNPLNLTARMTRRLSPAILK